MYTQVCKHTSIQTYRYTKMRIQSCSYFPQTDIWRKTLCPNTPEAKFEFGILSFGGGAARFTPESERESLAAFILALAWSDIAQHRNKTF